MKQKFQPRSKPNRRAFTTIEMLATVILASTTLLMAARLAGPMLSAARSEVSAHDSAIRCISFEHAIQNDVRNATAIDLRSPTEIRIETDGASIIWTLTQGDADRSLADGTARAEWKSVVAVNAVFSTPTSGSVQIDPAAGGTQPIYSSVPMTVNHWGRP